MCVLCCCRIKIWVEEEWRTPSLTCKLVWVLVFRHIFKISDWRWQAACLFPYKKACGRGGHVAHQCGYEGVCAVTLCTSVLAHNSHLTVFQALHGNSNGSSLQCKTEQAIGEFKLKSKRRFLTTRAVRCPPECTSATVWARIKGESRGGRRRREREIKVHDFVTLYVKF